ncbi:hypothetical protein PanWU01x14_266290 [Parasponia andersonii]|uniref:Uncharacterized protein n=1 Tax=Parasponia andersonii TaxID=3476 RepID=A0A2P5B721_PARAD|nr:hypothetical protein PanWU01x14_266290 [Parasponia andersonii]
MQVELLCPPEDAKKQKYVPMKNLMKDIPLSSGFLTHNIRHSPERKGKNELTILRNEVASFRSVVVGFPDHVGQMIEMEAKKIRNTILVEVKKLVNSVKSRGFVITIEVDNMMNIDEAENFVETSVAKFSRHEKASQRPIGQPP